MSLLIPKRKRRRYGDVKPKPLPTRGFEWLSPRTKEAQRFIRAPEIRRWGGRTLGQWGSVGGVAAPFLGGAVNPPSFAPMAPVAQAAPAAAVSAPAALGGVQAQAVGGGYPLAREISTGLVSAGRAPTRGQAPIAPPRTPSEILSAGIAKARYG